MIFIIFSSQSSTLTKFTTGILVYQSFIYTDREDAMCSVHIYVQLG